MDEMAEYMWTDLSLLCPQFPLNHLSQEFHQTKANKIFRLTDITSIYN